MSIMALLSMASSLTIPLASFAQGDMSAQNSGSTRIQIQRPSNQSDQREQRDPLKASAAVERDLGSLNNDEAAKLRAIFAQQASGGGSRQPKFDGNASQEDTNFRGQTPMLDRVLKGQNNQNNFRGRAQVQGGDNAPFIWAQSTQGGYYDCSGNYKGVVPGYRLKELGGKFADGTPVPRGNVKMNEAGHVWWQNDLSPSFKRY